MCLRQSTRTTLALVTRTDWTFTPKASSPGGCTCSHRSRPQSIQASRNPGHTADVRFRRLRSGCGYDSTRPEVVHHRPRCKWGDRQLDSGAGSESNFRSLRGNGVFRWEYRPGSALFFVWQQQRVGSEPSGTSDFSRDFRALSGSMRTTPSRSRRPTTSRASGTAGIPHPVPA